MSGCSFISARVPVGNVISCSRQEALAIAHAAPSPAPRRNDCGAARYSIRIVVQRIVEPGKKAYRVVAYGRKQALGHSDFHSLEHLLEVLRSAVPGFDARQFATADAPDEISSIIFADEVELDELATLGVG